ncbi:hypothetical protein SAMN04515679_1931 [Pelosinus fermentans]|uniref:Uncharacterized protein n=1 Tax=Pelosinus fermentans B4 TaxID=1149862 RepID=I9AVY1_9FIRM|nr:hypothetical protein FB4_4428 [Pelosinus fermentans B4]EIW23129.1 hypothetical protein FA11_4570 [Pelosinus fermentans A11]OAM93829.1 hypothetical protein FR7_01846 [Pelosinus fermentans DSM 17108]SDQ91504.1 hypothetical protein SAMN04515679_1931 [Pelosinus fermentans]
MITFLTKRFGNQYFSFFSWGYFYSAGYFGMYQMNRLLNESLNTSR